MTPHEKKVVMYDDDFCELGKELVVSRSDERGSIPSGDMGIESDNDVVMDHEPDEQTLQEKEIVPVRRGQRECIPSTRLDGFVLYTTHCSDDPLSLSLHTRLHQHHRNKVGKFTKWMCIMHSCMATLKKKYT
ncbi:unnamed protein product [Microthlaspi erraticum]|uniref:Uncharacterized protein n=1 Tax=Microthlaspi erraticum TaxID=1685480 RepID=A0A6D2HZV6_9BRAS|nr:unnamed protein product [Microthlaspi erraticum]